MPPTRWRSWTHCSAVAFRRADHAAVTAGCASKVRPYRGWEIGQVAASSTVSGVPAALAGSWWLIHQKLASVEDFHEPRPGAPRPVQRAGVYRQPRSWPVSPILPRPHRDAAAIAVGDAQQLVLAGESISEHQHGLERGGPTAFPASRPPCSYRWNSRRATKARASASTRRWKPGTAAWCSVRRSATCPGRRARRDAATPPGGRPRRGTSRVSRGTSRGISSATTGRTCEGGFPEQSKLPATVVSLSLKNLCAKSKEGHSALGGFAVWSSCRIRDQGRFPSWCPSSLLSFCFLFSSWQVARLRSSKNGNRYGRAGGGTDE